VLVSTPDFEGRGSYTFPTLEDFSRTFEIYRIEKGSRYQCNLAYDELEILQVQRKWEVSQALNPAIKEYQEAALRYRKMLKLKEPAHRCDKALSLWVQGPRRTKPGTQPPGAQFLRDSAMGEVYGESKPAPLKLRCRVLNLLQLMRKPTTSRRETSFIQDRVSIGEIAASDYLSENIARFNLLHKYTQVRGLNINTP
jgi:hypothetical protein